MKITAINRFNYSSDYQQRKMPYKKTAVLSQPAFKGELGQAAGSGIGMFAGVVASLFTGPIGALAIAGAGLIGGAIAGDKIEDSMNK